MSKTKMPKYDLLTILISAYLINMFHIKGLSSIQQLLVWGCIAFYLVYNSKYVYRLFKNKQCNNHWSIPIILFVFVVIYAFGICIAGPGDFGYIRNLFSIVLLVLYLLVIVVRLMKKYPERNLLESFTYLYIYVTVSYVIFTILILCFPFLKKVIIDVVEISDYSLQVIQNPYYKTRIGWMGFSGYASSMKCTISFCFVLYHILKKFYLGEKPHILHYVLCLLLLAGNFFYARTGAICSILLLMYALWYTALRQHKLKVFFGSVIIISFIVFLAYRVVLMNVQNSLSIQWMLEALINFMRDGKMTTTSQESLSGMYFKLPIETILMGDGRYTANGGFYMDTDVGIMRNLLYFGIIGTSLLYSVLLYSISKLRIRSKRLKYSVFPMMFFILFLIFELKGESTFLLIPLVFILNLLYPHMQKTCKK